MVPDRESVEVSVRCARSCGRSLTDRPAPFVAALACDRRGPMPGQARRARPPQATRIHRACRCDIRSRQLGPHPSGRSESYRHHRPRSTQRPRLCSTQRSRPSCRRFRPFHPTLHQLSHPRHPRCYPQRRPPRPWSWRRRVPPNRRLPYRRRSSTRRGSLPHRSSRIRHHSLRNSNPHRRSAHRNRCRRRPRNSDRLLDGQVLTVQPDDAYGVNPHRHERDVV